ncbi:hypothetical protein L207DRAFT_534751 [Hyaloscypha variabilis F]|uniref:Uncharacterized protein n=1 Tax=Hyaloscypha variabilis (strain UAMH 11265 / GT02V1 / F) TaxID=1149755 RepID=A0A2J6R7D4_HYAVF|nr:hypothetical protein L207DRAFT_534751 [Hyaloscypha variabilis F]
MTSSGSEYYSEHDKIRPILSLDQGRKGDPTPLGTAYASFWRVSRQDIEVSNRGDLQAIDSLILTCSGWLEQYHANSGVDPNTVGSVVQLQWFGYRIATIGDSPCGGPLLALSRQSDVGIWQKSVDSALEIVFLERAFRSSISSQSCALLQSQAILHVLNLVALCPCEIR